KVIFRRATVKVEANTTTANKLDYTSDLNLIEKQVFLKLLVSGKSNLYAYKDANSKSYYYELEKNEIEILEYKEYITENNQITENQNYKSQLWTNLKCSSIELSNIRDLDYKKSDMISFFIDYNTCMNDLTYTLKKEKRENTLHLSVRPGLNFSQANFDSAGNNFALIRDFEFDKETSFRLGIELEYILPFNNGKWSLIFEPTYQYYKTDKTFNSTPSSAIERNVTATVDYSSIEVPLGFRHYSYLNTNSRLFFNFSVFFDLSFKSEIEYIDSFYESDTGSNLSFGIGYSYKNKYSIEGRLHTKREILNEYATDSSEYANISVIFGCTIF
ncbi:MAG: hypothetical protein ACJASR_000515, partial [Psychroserpens sp.]